MSDGDQYFAPLYALYIIEVTNQSDSDSELVIKLSDKFSGVKSTIISTEIKCRSTKNLYLEYLGKCT